MTKKEDKIITEAFVKLLIKNGFHFSGNISQMGSVRAVSLQKYTTEPDSHRHIEGIFRYTDKDPNYLSHYNKKFTNMLNARGNRIIELTSFGFQNSVAYVLKGKILKHASIVDNLSNQEVFFRIREHLHNQLNESGEMEPIDVLVDNAEIEKQMKQILEEKEDITGQLDEISEDASHFMDFEGLEGAKEQLLVNLENQYPKNQYEYDFDLQRVVPKEKMGQYNIIKEKFIGVTEREKWAQQEKIDKLKQAKKDAVNVNKKTKESFLNQLQEEFPGCTDIDVLYEASKYDVENRVTKGYIEQMIENSEAIIRDPQLLKQKTAFIKPKKKVSKEDE